MVGILSGMWSTITGMISWLRDGLGITKAERRKQMEEEAAKTGNQAGGGLWKGAKWVDDASNYAKHQWYKAPGWYESTSSAEAHLLPEATQARLNARKVKYETAPAGFFEGIPGIGELTSAIGALTAAIPVLPDAGGFVGGVLDRVNAAIPDDVGNFVGDVAGKAGAALPSGPLAIPLFVESILPDKLPGIDETRDAIGGLVDRVMGEEVEAPGASLIPKSYTSKINNKTTITPEGWSRLDSDQRENWTPQYAVGATFKKDGLFTGQVHEKEEIIPQAIAQKGTGPLSKVLGDLQQSGQGAGGRSVNINIEEQLRVEVINPVVPDTGAAYQLTDIMKRQLDSHIEQTIMRKVAQYIT
ncbi:hypothetical protein [Methanothrix soehngenii]|uniref:hypothetical protein n=1 Tax=Methanothrix soehngenii TaxID=2223 RepID=UPI002FE3D1D2